MAAFYYLYNIQPTDHQGNLTKELAHLTYLLMIGNRVRVENVIFDSIYHCVFNRKNAALVFPHLISDLLTMRGMVEFLNDIHFPPDSSFKYEQVKGARVTMVPANPYIPDDVPVDFQAFYAEFQESKRRRKRFEDRQEKEFRHMRRMMDRMALSMGVEVSSEDFEDRQSEEEVPFEQRNAAKDSSDEEALAYADRRTKRAAEASQRQEEEEDEDDPSESEYHEDDDED